VVWDEKVIMKSGQEYLKENDGCPNSCLFVCWPQKNLLEFVKEYKGDKIIWIGEIGGCTGTIDTFEWRKVATKSIPTWPGLKDECIVYERK